MKALRDIETEPALYSVGDRVEINHSYELGRSGFYKPVEDLYEGTITYVGISHYNIAYDWYVIQLDSGMIIESWWMTEWKILKKLELIDTPDQGLPEPSGSPSAGA